LAYLLHFYCFLITNINKDFGQKRLTADDQATLTTMIKIFPIVNGGSRIIIGPLMDCFSFKFLYAMECIVVIILSSSIYFISTDITYYFIYNMISAFALGTNFALFPTFISKKFGLKNSSEIYGIIFLCFGSASLLGPIIAKFVLPSNVSTGLTPYLIVFLIGTGFAAIGLILVLLLDTKPFEYKIQKIEEEQINK